MIRVFPHHLSGLCFPCPGRGGLSTCWATSDPAVCAWSAPVRGQKIRCSVFLLFYFILFFFSLRIKSALFKGCSSTITVPEMAREQQLLCILWVLDLHYSLCPWIATLAITTGGLWNHCSTWRALNIFFMIQGQTQRQNSYCPHSKIWNKIAEAELSPFIQSCKLCALFYLIICMATARVFFFPCTKSQFWLTQSCLFQVVYSERAGEEFQKRI